MADNKGWRGYIYDAPWAKFASGQSGVIISEDGRECETLDNNISTIKIYAEPNTTFEDRSNGHILFRQKGSDLYDIVCLSQGEGGTYSIKVKSKSGKRISGCSGCTDKWSDFLDSIEVTETINGVERIISNEEKAQLIITPTQSEVCSGSLDYYGPNQYTRKPVRVHGKPPHESVTGSCYVTVYAPTTTTEFVRTDGVVEPIPINGYSLPPEIIYGCSIRKVNETIEEECGNVTADFEMVNSQSAIRKRYTIQPLTGVSFNNTFRDTLCNSSTDKTVVTTGVAKWTIKSTYLNKIYTYHFDNSGTEEGNNSSYALFIELNNNESLSEIVLIATPDIEGANPGQQEIRITLPQS